MNQSIKRGRAAEIDKRPAEAGAPSPGCFSRVFKVVLQKCRSEVTLRQHGCFGAFIYGFFLYISFYLRVLIGWTPFLDVLMWERWVRGPTG